MRAPDDRLLGPATGLGVLLSRLPFLTRNYGYDGDAWNVAWAARQMVENGGYTWSRAPGYPVHEIGTAVLWKAGPLAANGCTALLSAIGSMLFFAILRRLGARKGDAVLGALALAFVPVIYVNSSVTLDYLWALAFILGALLAVLAGRPVWGGAALGLAIGCRVTSGAMMVPLCVILALGGTAKQRKFRDLGLFVFSGLAVGLLTYAPALITYGPGALRFVDETIPLPVRLHLVAHGLTLGVWGTLGTLGLGVAAAGALPWLKRQPVLGVRDDERRILAWACLAAIALYVVSFARLPLEFAYLVPLVPFTLLAALLFCGRRAARVLLVFLLFAPFLWDIGFRQPASLAGPVLMDARLKAEQLDSIRAVYAHVNRLPASRVALVGPEINRLRALPSGTPGFTYTKEIRFAHERGLLEETEPRREGEALYLLIKERHRYVAGVLVETMEDGRERPRVDRF